MAKTAAKTQKVADLTPREVDTVLAANWAEQARTLRQIQHEQHAADYYGPKLPQLAAKHLAAVAALRTTLTQLQAAAKPYDAEYTRRRWHRYFLVTNGNGHVHRERNCSTCYPTTTYAWLVKLSGCDERAMVAEYGTDACSVCFPNAPVLARQLGVVSKTQREREAARAERAAKKAARDAKTAEKAITNPDGTKLVDADGWTINTTATAKQRLLDAAGMSLRTGMPNQTYLAQNQAAFERIALALAAKTGEAVDAIKAAALAKCRKRGY